MDAQRKVQMAESLRSRFKAETRDVTPKERWRWLLDHVDEYLDRWIAFCNADSVTMSSHIHSDLHVVLLMGVDLLEEELASLASSHPLKKTWQSFSELVRGIHSETSKDITKELNTRLAVVQRELHDLTSED